ncbi:MAG: hypothetical protein OEV43_02945 [Coriobacteriia bacterium]|nr:hypothetical protein [Coriobacteriia bacterium]
MNAFYRRDDGFAMVAVMGIIALITVIAIAGFFLANQVLSESQRVEDESKAFQVAQSGLDRELATFNPSAIVGGSYSKQGSTPDGVYTVEARQLGGFEYMMTSTGVAEGRTESVTQRFYYIDLWNMNIGAGEQAALGGGRGWNGNASITGPLYIRGTLDWAANGAYEAGPLFIRDGDLNVTGSGELGKVSPIDLFLTGSIVGKTTQVYYKSLSSSVPDITLPWVDDYYMDEMLRRAVDESVDNIMGSPARSTVANDECSGADPTTYAGVRAAGASDYYKSIGDGTGRAALGAGVNDLSIDMSSFGRWDDGLGTWYPAGSGLHDDFAYDVGTGTLYVEGTVFIDGNLEIGPLVRQYVGNGTLVVNGNVFVAGRLQPVSGQDALGVVGPGDVTIGKGIHGHEWPAFMQGAIFANGTIGLYHTGTDYVGSILGGTIYGDKPEISLTTDPTLPGRLPESLPGAGGGIVFPGTWTRD